jgi:hypothetical protein
VVPFTLRADRIAGEQPVTLNVEATVVSIEQHNGSYVQKKKSTSELFYVAELLLNGADDVQIQVKAMGDTVGTLLGEAGIRLSTERGQ